MAETWLYGIFGDGQGSVATDGTCSPDNILVAGKNTDKITIDVTGEANASLNISREDLPANWKTEILVTGRTMLALVDGDKVLFAGYLDKINSNMNGSLTLIVKGIRAYMNRQQTNDTYGTVQTNPNVATVFNGVGYSGLAENVVRKCFSNNGVPVGVRPANILGDFFIEEQPLIPGQPAQPTVTYESKHSALESFGNILTNITNKLSDWGIELWFVPRWESVSNKTRIVWDVRIGNDAYGPSAHINEASQFTLGLDATTTLAKASAFGVTYSVEKTNTRYVGQSKAGQDNDGADITSKYVTNVRLPRFDGSFNPGLEVSQSQLDALLVNQLASANEFSEAFYTVEEDFSHVWLDRLGSRIEFVAGAGADFSEFNLLVRCVSVSFSASSGKVELGVMVLLRRYKSLPRNRKEDDSSKPITENPAKNSPLASTTPPREKTSELLGTWNAIGMNKTGQLGIGSITDTEEFAQIQQGERPESTDFVSIFPSAGSRLNPSSVIIGQNYDYTRYGWTHGITSDGSVYGWGDNSFGQLGIDSSISAEFLSVPYRCDLFLSPVKQIVGFYNENAGSLGDISAMSVGLSSDGMSVQVVGTDTNGSFLNNWTPSSALKKIQTRAEIIGESDGDFTYQCLLLGITETGSALCVSNGQDSEANLLDLNGNPITNATDIGDGWVLTSTGIHYALNLSTKTFERFFAVTGVTKVASADYVDGTHNNKIQRIIYIKDGSLFYVDTKEVTGGESHFNSGPFMHSGAIKFKDIVGGANNNYLNNYNGEIFSIAALQEDGTLWINTPSIYLGTKVTSYGWTKYATSSKVSKIEAGLNGSLFVKKAG
jgi:hypothetical protein